MFNLRNCFIVILVLLMPTVVLAGHPNHCAQQNVVGTYAVMSEGTTIMTLEDGTQMPVPVASLLIVAIAPEGNASHSGYVALGDQIMRFGIEPDDPPMVSTITLNSDCTGIEEFNDGMVVELIVQKGGAEINSIMVEGGALGAPAITGRWKRISWVPYINANRSPVCSPLCVRGTYVAQQSGFNFVPEVGPVPGGWLGHIVFYHDNTFECRGMAMPGGTQMPFTFANGVWEDGELECTATGIGDIMAYGVQYVGQVENWFVVLDGGSELWGIALSEPAGSPVSLVTAKRSSVWPISLE